MSGSPFQGTNPKGKQAERALAAAHSVLDCAETSPKQRHLLLRQAAFLTRLAAALLLEPEFPALPQGFWRLLDRDRARQAAVQLSESQVCQWQSHTQRGLQPTPYSRHAGRPQAEIDYRLAAATAETLCDLKTVRRELFQDYLDLLRCEEPGSANPGVQEASLALLEGYWRDRKRLPRLGVVHRSTAVLRRPWWRGIVTQLHPPSWKHDVTWEMWDSLDRKTLYWSDPLPAEDPVATSLSECRTISVNSQHP